jgi:SAM-dependent methyltransferase
MTNTPEYNYSLHYPGSNGMDSKSMSKNIIRFNKLLKDVVPQDKTARILDVGCATGEALLALKELEYENLLGIDIDNNLIDIAKQNDAPAEHAEDTEEYLNQKKNQFDAILLLDVLEHIPITRQISFIRSIYNALAPHGKLILMVPNAYCPVAMAMRYGDFTHKCSFTPNSIKFILQNAGFDNIKVTDLTPKTNAKVSLRFWRTYARKHYRELFVRKMWRTMFEIFMPHEGEVVPISVNILVESSKVSIP